MLVIVLVIIGLAWLVWFFIGSDHAVDRHVARDRRRRDASWYRTWGDDR